MTTAEPPAVAIEGVSHCYGRRQALNDVTFSIAPSIFAVLLANYDAKIDFGVGDKLGHHLDRHRGIHLYGKRSSSRCSVQGSITFSSVPQWQKPLAAYARPRKTWICCTP